LHLPERRYRGPGRENSSNGFHRARPLHGGLDAWNARMRRTAQVDAELTPKTS
jgi:hypothetical protein